jgi:lysophospholipase L1-like esterase
VCGQGNRYDPAAREFSGFPQVLDKDVNVMRTPPVKGLASAMTLAAALIAAPQPASAAPMQTYLALGDSMAFGETDFTQNPSNGDRGYVKPFANFLGSHNGGVVPQVVNLGVDGETSSTFLSGGPVTGNGTPGQPGYSLNTNYPSMDTSQNAQMLETIVHQIDSGQNISTVSLQIGANDLLSVMNSPGFLNLTPDQQQAKISAAIATIQMNTTTILSEIHSLLPHANVLVLGYHDPFAFPGSKLEPLTGPAIQALNSVVAGEASAFGAKYVDVYDALKGNILQDTFISSGNVHPNGQGYAAIELAMEAASVPEPSTLLVLGTGFAGWFALGRRSRRQAS